MGGKASKVLLPQSQRVVATHLSSAKEAEKAAQKLRDGLAASDGMHQGKYPTLSRADTDMVSNMHQIMGSADVPTAITRHVDPSVMPEGAFVPGAKRKLAGRGQVHEQPKRPLQPEYGLDEGQLRNLFAMRGGVVGDTAESKVVNSLQIAQNFKLKQEDVHLILKYLAPVTPIPGDEKDEIMYSNRKFDRNPAQ
mmetsp:Transcript_20866/g.48217  ORF Transcript_20866/g.48217 Transcript_20866/m.48217 type:complete len:194 (-) Transcript_20866:1066-1647(-)